MLIQALIPKVPREAIKHLCLEMARQHFPGGTDCMMFQRSESNPCFPHSSNLYSVSPQLKSCFLITSLISQKRHEMVAWYHTGIM